MVSDTQKLLLRAFNTECDELIGKVKYTNFDATLNRIYKSSEAISKLGTIMGISVTQTYLDAKVKELRLAFEYQQKKQEEKEAAKIARAEQREQAKLERELEAQHKKIEKEQSHYQRAYEQVQRQLELSPNDTNLLEKQRELEEHLEDVDKALADIDYRQANMKAGYVYVISNIGSFGKDIYKIGMTRRLEPTERVDELGGASVPFNFDIHAMMFSDNAPALEAALHRAFADRKVNMVNQRREFFHVTLDEIKEVIKANYDKTVEFTDTPDAEQYRISMKMRGEDAPLPDGSKPSHAVPANNPRVMPVSTEPTLLPEELKVLDRVKTLIGADGISYNKDSEYAYMYVGSPNKWICRVSIHPDNNLIILNKFEDSEYDYETDYYFDDIELLDQLADHFKYIYENCLRINKLE